MITIFGILGFRYFIFINLDTGSNVEFDKMEKASKPWLKAVVAWMVLSAIGSLILLVVLLISKR